MHGNVTMKTTPSLTMTLSSLGMTALLATSSCTPDPTLQKQMDHKIMTAAELEDKKKDRKTTGPQHGRGSQSYGIGAY